MDVVVEVEEVDDVEVEDEDVVEVEVEEVEIEDMDVEVRCMLDDWEVTLVIIFPLYVWSCFGWQLLMLPLGHAVMFRYIVPVIVLPGEIF